MQLSAGFLRERCRTFGPLRSCVAADCTVFSTQQQRRAFLAATFPRPAHHASSMPRSTSWATRSPFSASFAMNALQLDAGTASSSARNAVRSSSSVAFNASRCSAAQAVAIERAARIPQAPGHIVAHAVLFSRDRTMPCALAFVLLIPHDISGLT
jgi:hypothetical protein